MKLKKAAKVRKLRATKGLYFYTPKDYINSGKITVAFRALSHKELLVIENLGSVDGRYAEANLRAVEFAVEFIENAVGNKVAVSLVDLPLKVIEELANKILECSVVTQDEYDLLQSNLEIYFDPTFQSETWQCAVCREKRLDRVRNCGFRGEKNKDPDFVVYVNNHPFTYCPIYDLNKELLSDAIDCYNAFDSGFLPDSGGLYDQTRFFVIASQEIFAKIKENERKELEKLKKKS